MTGRSSRPFKPRSFAGVVQDAEDVKFPEPSVKVHDPWLINPLALVGIMIGILILRLLKGGGVLMMGLHSHDPSRSSGLFNLWDARRGVLQ